MRFFIFTTYAVFILLSFFLLSCEADKIDISEILNKSEVAIGEIKSLEYEKEITQTIDNPLFDDITYGVVTSGKSIKDPIAYEIIIKSTVEDEEMETKLYFSDDTIYHYDPDSGWTWEEYDNDNNDIINVVQIDSFDSINVLLEIGVDDISVEENEGQYLITYRGDNKEIAKHYRKEFIESLSSITKDFDTVLAAAGSIDYSDFDYTLVLDKETFLPETYSVSYKSRVKLLDEDINVTYDSVTRYLQYDSLTTEDIVIPTEATENVVEKAEEGTIEFEDGTYVGELRNGEPHGHGTYTFHEGSSYVGSFKNGYFHGHGELTFRGNKYVGEFKDDLFHGQGTLYLEDGGKLECEWEAGEPHGQGVLTRADGSEQSGRWVHGNYVGY